ncbi:MAG TPA: sulfatase-like hydrolase/transferase [Bacteroidales bacterium]|nr:sulfatase-like hydrolase/transferase [Bacteroidales bacterium]
MSKNWLLSRNMFNVLIYRILVVMLLFTLCRIGFYVFNYQMFPGVTFSQFVLMIAGGFVFDVSAAVYINSLIIVLHIVPFNFRYNDVYQKVIKYIFFIVNGLAIAMNGMDFVYYRFVYKRATADVFGTFSNESNLGKLFFRFLFDYWPATLFTIFLWFLMVWLYRKVKPQKPDVSNKIAYYSINVLMIPLVIALVIGAARGGYKHSTRPITISNAARYVESPRDVAIVLNTPFSILRTYGKKPLERLDFFDDTRLKELYNPHHMPSGKGSFRNDNVIVIILESFAREYIGGLNQVLEGGNYSGYTTFIDSLLKVSLTFDVSVANGKKSIDAMPSILSSIPSLETPYIISHYANNQISGFPDLLKRKGYYTAFFHGAPNGSMGFDSFAKMIGFDDYFGLDQYPDKDDFDGIWGVWDEPFFDFFAKKLNSFKQPFMASIFSVSSHHPFMVPEKYKGKFKKGAAPIVEVIGYTDFALKKFFSQIAVQPWFSNTLFVITADHTNESIHKEFQNDFGSYSIPVIFYKPGSDLKGIRKRIAQQVDIMPTVLYYLNYDEEFIAFGNNLLDDTFESFGFNTNGNNYHLYMRDHILEMVDKNSIGLFNYKNDIFLERNLIGTNPELQKLMEDKMKAIMQTYNTRLLDNNMIIRKTDN